MATQTIIWTVLPNGVDPERGVARISVHVGIRLITSDGYRTFGDFSVGRWPELRWQLPLEVTAGGETNTLATTRVAPAAGVPSPEIGLWTRIFPADLPVVGHRASKLPSCLIHSAPVTNLVQLGRGLWRDWLIASPTTVPRFVDVVPDGFTEAFRVEDFAVEDPVAARAELDQRSAGRKALPAIEVSSPEHSWSQDLTEHARFFDRSVPRRGSGEESTIDRTPTPEFDAHQAMALVGQHPSLMRRLGLLIDLEVSLSELLSAVGGTGVARLRVVPAESEPVATSKRRGRGARATRAALLTPATSLVTPLTVADAGPDRLAAATRPGDLVTKSGALAFDNHDIFRPIEFDVDGMVFKLENFSQWLIRLRDRGSNSTDPELPLPSLRSFGLGVNRRNAAVDKVARFARMGTLEDRILDQQNPGQQRPELFADDLTRGIRVHVFDGQWRSLHSRLGRYEIGRGTEQMVVDVEDEGWVTSAPAGEPGEEDERAPNLFLQESLFLWSGWSLSAPRPGRAIDDDRNLRPSEINPASTNIAMSATFRVKPGSLPSLRFGRQYRFRAHATDLAGNSIGFGEPTAVDGAGPATEPVTYQRFEPVPPPPVLLRSRRTEGEANDRLVIRTDIDLAPSEVTSTERHLVPPRSSQLTAEQHGLFDVDGRLDTTLWSRLGTLDAFTLENSSQGTVEPARPGDPADAPVTRFYDVDTIDIGYMPDPLAVGLLLRELPGWPDGEQFVAPFARPGEAWPSRRPIRLRLTEGNGPPTISDVGGGSLITVQIPKGTTHVVRYNSAIDPADPELPKLLGMMGFLDGVDEAIAAPIRAAVLASEVWMVTPYRALTLVNASRRPIEPAVLTGVSTSRVAESTTASRGATGVTLGASITLHAPSTSKIEVMASWTDQFDPGLPLDQIASLEAVAATPEPAPRTTEVTAFEVPLEQYDDTDPSAITREDLTHNLGDTRHHTITYTPIATTAFAEYFTERRTLNLGGTGEVIIDAAGFVRGSVRITDPTRAIEYQIGRDLSVDHGLGSVARIAGGAIADGGSIEVAYVRPQITRRGPGVVIDVASTARPAPPAVRYLVPTFQWEQGGSLATGKTSTRRGNALRVWLDRPWYSSGNGELLGVVLNNSPQFGPPTPFPPSERLAPYVTQYGNDPITDGGNVRGEIPTIDNFRARALSRQGVQLLEQPTELVDIAAHSVEFDSDRKLWFCDIEIDAGRAYFPFVRLALARYQPSSIAGVEISAVVLADFMQLAPDRSATVTALPTQSDSVTISLTGITSAELIDNLGQVRRPRTEMRVLVERQDPGGGGELSWAPSRGAEPTPLRATSNADGSTTWEGTIGLIASRTSVRQRLVIEEFERRATRERTEPGYRIVYTDIISL